MSPAAIDEVVASGCKHALVSFDLSYSCISELKNKKINVCGVFRYAIFRMSTGRLCLPVVALMFYTIPFFLHVGLFYGGVSFYFYWCEYGYRPCAK